MPARVVLCCPGKPYPRPALFQDAMKDRKRVSVCPAWALKTYPGGGGERGDTGDTWALPPGVGGRERGVIRVIPGRCLPGTFGHIRQYDRRKLQFYFCKVCLSDSVLICQLNLQEHRTSRTAADRVTPGQIPDCGAAVSSRPARIRLPPYLSRDCPGDVVRTARPPTHGTPRENLTGNPHSELRTFTPNINHLQ
uniref:Uncharacterized protein n=1 Tax=Branchiostoma floridae TaxID=7739 RepID=C3Y5P9_BRAFL|eukprot:XP_002608286.1 hypothetical protein BRAFLDRAFT_87966 [Branchiostoma floridae]